ncbi:MAG: glycosyltransferase family 4 protein [Verrucomicrobiia bacterium]
MRPLRIAFLTEYDARNVNRWSGTAYFMSQSLKECGFIIEYIGPLKERFQFYIRAMNYFYKLFSKKNFFPFATPLRLKSFARQARKKLAAINYDLVVAPNMWALAYLDIKKPSVLWADCTFASMVDFYPDYTNLCAKGILNGNRAESKALRRCALAVFASEWAANSAISYYGVSAEKIRVIPYGANIVCSRRLEDIEKLVQSRPARPCKLLFIGKVWERKGGDVAVEVAKTLNRLGLETELTLVGSLPKNPGTLPSFIKPLGFIDKSTDEGKTKIERLFSESHFLIVPSRAEAYGIVFCEASSFGIPSIATNVGGIPTVIKDGVNGKTFTLTATPEEYAKYILSIINNYDEYKKLSFSSFNEYRNRLNWSVATKKFGEAITNFIN